ncbi:MAG: flagellar biosynthesis protein FlhA [Fibrobacterales bacterium]
MSIKDGINLGALAKHKDVLIIISIVGVIVMMVVPIPTWLIDILLSLMISLALVVLIISMYLDNVLDFSVFPGLLLVLTLFRIAMNISTTRMILADGEAGEVINSFSNFVTGNNIVVGVIIFIIIVMVQLIVITKGSGRIAEVAARFTLDAMPGKQMAVDADLNAGILTEDEAKQKRKDISREADFYGAMDGASKFVKGDATAGLVITVVNIIGGFATGMAMQGMDFFTALETYTKLTIGDGLVSQVPSLMISTGAGIIVTRAASSGNLGQELIAQFSQSTKALFASAGVMMFLGLVPGMPIIPFTSLAIMLAFGAYKIATADSKKKEEETQSEEELSQGESGAESAEERIEDYLKIDQMELEIGYGLIPLVDTNQGGDLLERITMLRRQCATELGIIVPPIRIRDNIQLQPNDYIVKVKGLEVGSGNLMMGSYLAMNPGEVSQQISGIETVEPAFGLPALWITESQKETAELSGYTVVELPAVLATHITEVIKGNAADILTRQDVKALVDTVKQDNSAVVDELIPGLLGFGELQTVLTHLLSEKVSIRNLSAILEILSDSAKMSKETTYLTEECRAGLSRQICMGFNTPDGVIPVITLDPQLEQLLEASVQKTEKGPRLVLRPDVVGKILDATAPICERLLALNEQQILVCSPNIRFPMKMLLEGSYPNLSVLAYSEIVTGINIKSTGTISIHENEKV